MRPKVSFLVAVYNVADYVEACVRSLCQQTMKEIEIVIVDDCTPDDSMARISAVLDEFPDRKGQVKIIHHEHNLGVQYVRRDGFNASSGEYVIFIDGDDYVDVRMAELMYAKAVESDADQVICDYCEVDGDTVLPLSIVRGNLGEDGKNVDDDIINCSVLPYAVIKAFRRELFTDHIIIWPPQGMGDDTVISTQISYYSKRTVHIAMPLYYYCQSPNSFCRTKGMDAQLRRFRQFRENILTYIFFLEREGVANKYKLGLLTKKKLTKNFLLPFMSQRKYRRLWVNTFPEVNRVLIFGSRYYHPTRLERVRTAALCLGIYPILKKLL